MSNRMMRVFGTAILLISVLGGSLISGAPAAADDTVYTTTSLHIVKYATDGVTVLAQTTVSLADLKAMPVQGDGTTHYFTQGPNLTEESVPYDTNTALPNLKDYGALEGTNLADLCNLVGGMSAGDQVELLTADSYSHDAYNYANVYTPGAEQGDMVLCWSKNGQDVPTYPEGILLACFPTILTPMTGTSGIYDFTNQAMHDSFPGTEHWYYDGATKLPSAQGMYSKYVSEIDVYTGGAPSWQLTLTGAVNETIPSNEFDECQGASGCHGSTTVTPSIQWTNPTTGDTYQGMPLYLLCGRVDDTTNIHGAGAFNSSLFYDVKVTGTGGYYYTFESTDVAYNDKIILADKVEYSGTSTFVPLPTAQYPLKIVGDFAQGGPQVSGVTEIDLENIALTPPNFPPINPTTADWPLMLYGAQQATVTQSDFASCATCHGVTFQDGSDIWSGIPLWRLMGLVDDTAAHGAGDFNDRLATAGYDVKVVGADGYTYDLDSATVARNNNIIVANTLNGQPLAPLTDTGHPLYPLKVVGNLAGTGWMVGSLVRIDLRNIQSPPAWDLNGDHHCDISDLVVIGLQWGKTGAHGWIKEDLNNDGVINISDVVVLGLSWGLTWTST